VCLYTHIAVGALAGSFAPDPFLAGAYGVGSHVILDFVPHFDFERVRDELLLGALALGMVLLIAGGKSEPLVGALLGGVPDLENLFWKRGMIADEEKIFPSHSGLVPHGVETGRANLLVQTILAVVALSILAR